MKDWDLHSQIDSLLNMDDYAEGRSLPFNDIMILDADLQNPENNQYKCHKWNQDNQAKIAEIISANEDTSAEEQITVPEDKFFVIFLD